MQNIKINSANQYSKDIQPKRKAGKRLKHTLHKRRFPNGHSGQLHSSSEKTPVQCHYTPSKMARLFLIAKT